MPRLTKTKTLPVGLDLGDRRHTACVLDEAAEMIAEEALANNRELLNTICARERWINGAAHRRGVAILSVHPSTSPFLPVPPLAVSFSENKAKTKDVGQRLQRRKFSLAVGVVSLLSTQFM